jgi:4-hydroxyproline epimerase
MQRVRIVDSHTGGEPTRLVLDGGPELTGSLPERVVQLREQHDHFRSAVVNEPRGNDVMVGALLTPPTDPTCTTGVIFFNNVGYLNMCGHGTIGLIATLAWLGRLAPGEHRIETPVGVVTTELLPSGEVSVRNIPAWRHAKGVTVNVAGHGPVTGDVAWGGNWFYLVQDHGQALDLAHAEALTDFTWRVREALEREGITGEGGGHIDHIELFGPPQAAGADSRNFVLCPGKAYDRSPCGTGTSAKLACLAADGKLAPGQPWVQESITGSTFTGTYTPLDKGIDEVSGEALSGGRIEPTIRGRAYVNAEATLLLDPADPLCFGLRP